MRLNAPDLARTTFAVLFIGLLLGVSLWILRPFLGPALWAAMVVVASWPLLLRVQRTLWNRRSLAVVVMSLLLLLVFVVPLLLAIVTIIENADRLVEWGRLAANFHLPDEPPRWLLNLPLLGGVVQTAWEQATLLGLRDYDLLAHLGCKAEHLSIARIRGDEFTVLLPDLREAADAVKVGKRILEVLTEPFKLESRELFITVSIGIADLREEGLLHRQLSWPVTDRGVRVTTHRPSATIAVR